MVNLYRFDWVDCLQTKFLHVFFFWLFFCYFLFLFNSLIFIFPFFFSFHLLCFWVELSVLSLVKLNLSYVECGPVELSWVWPSSASACLLDPCKQHRIWFSFILLISHFQSYCRQNIIVKDWGPACIFSQWPISWQYSTIKKRSLSRPRIDKLTAIRSANYA